jgi:hypothetical protein
MGFQRKPYRLVWPQESRWSGLEVVLRGMTIAELEEIAALKEKVEDSSNLKQILPLLDVLERALLEWNLEDEQGAPISVSALREQDMAMIMAIIAEWTQVVGDVPAPLSQPSPAGEKFQVELMPMEIPSASRLNLSTQS